MAKMQSGAPAQKVMGSSIGAAIAAIVVYFLPDVPVEGDLSVALTKVITFIFGYFMPPLAADTVVE